jgi:GT2 family glycosyltransferase
LSDKQTLEGLSIVIPTYGREGILLESIAALLDLEFPANEIIVVDQTSDHKSETSNQLYDWHESGSIRWLKRDETSITKAMNWGLMNSKNNLVLFLDDDIKPHKELVLKHVQAHQVGRKLWATVGQVIQPWQSPEDIEPSRKLDGLQKDFDFPFNSTRDAYVENVMAGNLCVHRERAISVGGFDENYVGTAFRFESEFARRLVNAGGKILFIGSAGIDHLRATSGGTRSKGSHLTSASPLHGFGDYYYAFRHGEKSEAWKYSIQRFFREVRTKFHLTHPWWIPVKMLGEARALLMAMRVLKSGQKLINKEAAV